MTTARVVIVDDHAVVREGTRKLLEHDSTLCVVGETGSGLEAVRLVWQSRPDVVLLDLALPDISGIEVARRILAALPETRIIVLSAYDDDDYVFAALDAGVAAYLMKTVRGQEVIETIHAVYQGQVILHPQIADKLRRRSVSGAEPNLSQREMEVLRLAARGLHNKDIAQALSISLRTVEGHFSNILTKLAVDSRTEAVVLGIARHWFDPSDPGTDARERRN